MASTHQHSLGAALTIRGPEGTFSHNFFSKLKQKIVLTMANIRRISTEEVKIVFDCFRENKAPPEHLRFEIVPAGTSGMKLSPPPFEFQDGLYILKMAEKRSKIDSTPIPSNLASYVMKNFPPLKCPWSLSGPQFPQPTPLQQRYCYPKGESEYASQKGGSLWTISSDDGKEDFTYRLLHVYFSEKRANSTSTVPPSMLAAEKKNNSEMLNARNEFEQNSVSRSSPQASAFSSTKASIQFDIFGGDLIHESPSVAQSRREEPVLELYHAQQFASHHVTPGGITEISSSDFIPAVPRGSQRGRRHPNLMQITTTRDSKAQIFPSITNYCPPSSHRVPRQYPPPNHFFTPNLPCPVSLQYTSSSQDIENEQPARKRSKHENCVTPSTTEEITMLEFEAFWTDPFRLNESLACISDQDIWTKAQRIESFEIKLQVIHRSILQKITEAPEEVRDSLVSILSSWASHVANCPTHSSPQTAEV